MGYAEMATRLEERNSRFNTIQQVMIGLSNGNVLSVDENHDNNYEVQKVYSESGNSIFENFDFDSNGAIDYARYFHEKGNQFAEYFYSNNPENNEEYKPTLIEKICSFFDGA